jgi:Uma2 family endonuclease
MNVAWTQAAEGLPRRVFTVEDVHRMVDAGVIGENENFELIEGEFVMMAAKSIAHDRVKNALTVAFSRAVPDSLFVGIENTIQLSDTILVEPDIALIKRSVFREDPKGFASPAAEDVLLLVEIAVSWTQYDLGIKARLYARHGIREFWVVDVNQQATWVHTQPSAETWTSVIRRAATDALTTPALPGFSIKLSEID